MREEKKENEEREKKRRAKESLEGERKKIKFF